MMARMATTTSNVFVLGTPAEKAVIDSFDIAGTNALEKMEIVSRLEELGFRSTTISRALNSLRARRNVALDGQTYFLIRRELDRRRVVHDPRKVKSNHFNELSTKSHAAHVRSVYIDRLDKLFENPNGLLVRVLRAVELAGRIADAAILKRPDALEDAIAEYRREWLDVEPNQWRRPLDSARIFEALAVGLFPEEFNDDPEVAARLQSHYENAKQRRDQLIADVNAENERRRNLPEPLPRLELDRSHFADPIDCTRGLIPVNGGARVGLLRLRAFLETVGQHAEADHLADVHGLPHAASRTA